MPMYVIAAAAGIAAAIPLLVWSLASARTPTKNVARNLMRQGTDLREAILLQSAQDRAVRPFMHGLAAAARRVTPIGLVDRLERRVVIAGRPPAWPIERVLAAKLILGAGGVLFGVLWLFGGVSLLRLLFAIGVTALGYFAPDLILISRGQERQKLIQLALPDTLDQMTISVEAGLGFEAAMSRAAANGHGPLAEELVRTLQEMQVGVARNQAFRNLGARTSVPDLRHFVLAVIQAETYGIPVADVLRTQAGELRIKRRQRAEERAMKIPVKLVFPLVLCILPALFVVIIGPAVIRIARALFGGAL